MDPADSVELNTACLEHVFSFLSGNHLVLLIKPLSKHFKDYVKSTQKQKADKVAASELECVPLWALPSLGAASLTYTEKKQLMRIAAKGGCLLTLQWAREEGCPWDRTVSDAAAEGGCVAMG